MLIYEDGPVDRVGGNFRSRYVQQNSSARVRLLGSGSSSIGVFVLGANEEQLPLDDEEALLEDALRLRVAGVFREGLEAAREFCFEFQGMPHRAEEGLPELASGGTETGYQLVRDGVTLRDLLQGGIDSA